MTNTNNDDARERFTIRLKSDETIQLALVLLFYFLYGFSTTFLYDDAYFFVRYGENILNGHGYTWNAGQPPVDGLTSPLWLVVVLSGMLIVPIETARSGILLITLSTIFAVLLVLLIYYVLRAFLPPQARSLAILGPLFFVLTDVNLLVAGQSGMETALASCMVVGFIALVCSYHRDDGMVPIPTMSALMIGVFGFALVLARPEFGLISSLCPLALWLSLLARRSSAARGVFYWGVTTALLLVLYGTVRVLIFNDLFPQSFYIKGSVWKSPYKDFNAKELSSLAAYSYFFLRETAVLHLLIFYALSQKKLYARFAWLWVPVYLCMIYLSFSIQIMGYLHRYYFPFACAMVTLIGFLYGRLAREKAVWFDWIDQRAVNAAVLCGLALYIVTVACLPQTQVRSIRRTIETQDYRVATFLNKLPHGTRVVATEMGIIAAQNPHLEFIDIAGLNDATFARGFDVEELFARKPEVFTMIHHHYGGMTSDITNHPTFRREYVPLKNMAPWGGEQKLDNTMFVWKNSPNYERIRRAILSTPEPLFD